MAKIRFLGALEVFKKFVVGVVVEWLIPITLNRALLELTLIELQVGAELNKLLKLNY